MSLPKNPLLSEATVNLIITQLQSNFNALLADIDNQYQDGISLEPVDNDSIYISYGFKTLRPPAIYVLMNDHAFQYSKDPNYMESQDTMIVVVSAEDMGDDVLTKKVWRYGRVLYGCLSLIDLVTADSRLKIHCVPQRLAYSQPVKDKLSKQGGKFRMDVVLNLKVLHYENFLT